MTKNTAAAAAAELFASEDAGAPESITCRGNTFVVRVRLENGRVTEAWSTGRMMRNMNVLLRGGLDERGRPRFVQQAHCLCNDGHALAAIRALEDLAGVVLPHSAVQVRSLVQSLRCIQEHLLHVYHFHLSDWASLHAALRADPAKTAGLARLPGEDAAYFRSAQARLRAFAEEQADGVFGARFPDHPDYRGPDELHLLVHAHGLEALRTGGAIQEALGLLGCGPEGFRAYHMGGLPEGMDLGPDLLDRLRGPLEACRDFVRLTFLDDLERLARVYGHWAQIGAGTSFLAWEDFTAPAGDGPLFPGGIITPAGAESGSGEAWAVRPAAFKEVAEEREPQWAAEDRERYRLLPGRDGLSFQWGEGEFFWLPAPRYGEASVACEAGPLARVLGGLAHGRGEVRRILAGALDACGLAPAALNSTLGRVLARGVESLVLAEAALERLDVLEAAPGGDARCECRLPASGLGVGRVEVPRGALTHTIRLEGSSIADHDYLIPSLWNFSPRDSGGGLGPLERALLGTVVADPGRPLEILRTVHELDPCNACHVVVEDMDGGRSFVADAT